MSQSSRSAMAGGCLGSLTGLILGAILGLVLGAALVGNRPVGPPSDDGQRETVRQIQVAGNTGAKFLGGLLGMLIGGVVGAVAGAGIGASMATKIGAPQPPTES